MTEKEIGPAAPCLFTGMTLRDLFAGMAISGLLSNPNASDNFRFAITQAWKIADAMIDARENGENGK